MKTATHTRNNYVITNRATGKREFFKSINKAKKESRNIQLSDGGLGCGAVIVIS